MGCPNLIDKISRYLHMQGPYRATSVKMPLKRVNKWAKINKKGANIKNYRKHLASLSGHNHRKTKEMF